MTDRFENLLVYGLQTSLAVSLLIVLVLLIRKPVRKLFGAQTAYMLWALPFLRLFLPPLPAGWSPFASLWPAPAETLPATAPAAAAPESVPPVLLADMAPAETYPAETGVAALDSSITPLVASGIPAPSEWFSFLALAWIAGLVLILGVTWLRQQEFRQKLPAHSFPPTPRQRDQVMSLHREFQLSIPVSVLQSNVIKGPMVSGTLRPVVLLPEYFDDDYTPEEQRAAIAHELAHVKRGDLWALMAARLFLALQWFNPLAHMAMKTFRIDQEAACDATTLTRGSLAPHIYAATLIKAVRPASPPDHFTSPVQQFSPALTMGHPVNERLSLMKNPAPSRALRFAGTAMALVLGASALVATSCTSAAHADNITISNSSFSIDGKVIKDRKFVLLSNPFEGLEPEFDKLSRLELEIPDFDMPEIIIPEIPDMPDMPEPPEVREIKVEGGTKIIIPAQEIFIPDNLDEIEAYAEEAARKAEAYAEKYEKVAEQIEDQLDEIMTDDFEDRIDDATDIIDDLADACVDHEFTSDTPVIFSEQSESGDKTFKALCVRGTGDVLNSARVESFVRENSSLTGKEKSTFFKSRDSNSRIDFSFSRDEEDSFTLSE